MEKLEVKYRNEDLVYLVYTPNTLYAQLQEEMPKGVTVDVVEGTWTFKTHLGEVTRQIGFSLDGNHYAVFEGRPIGGYDRTKIEHLKEMLSRIHEMAMKLVRITDD